MSPQTAPEPQMSEPARIAGVYMEPTKTYADIAVRPQRWWIPMILVVVVSLAFTYCYSQRVGWRLMMQHEFETNTRMQNIPPDQREQALNQAVKFAGISSYVGPIVAIPVGSLAIAGILMLVMNGLLGAQLRFVQSLAIVAYSSLVGVLSGILSIIVMFIKSPEDFDIRNPLAFNGGAFLSATAPKWLTALASSFDLFTFWTIALMAVGYAATTRKMTFAKALTGVAGMWLVWVVVKTGWAAMMG